MVVLICAEELKVEDNVADYIIRLPETDQGLFDAYGGSSTFAASCILHSCS